MMPSPVPIDVVAKHYLGEPFSKSDREWRYGNKGSLSINLDNNVWFDHEADEGGGVVDFIKRQEGPHANVTKILDDKFGAPERCPISLISSSKTPPRIHDYDGFYQKVKSAEGRWTTRHPDGNGGFSPGMGEQQHRLYGQADLEALKLAEQPIFFVEGEKDVDTLRRHNLFAVSSGSTSSWRDDFAHLFAGHDVKIIPDNDAAGLKFAAQVMAALKPVTASVGIISLPDMPEKGDVSDYLTTHCVEEFLALEAKTTRLKYITHSEMLNTRQASWLIEGMLPEVGVAIIAGAPGSLKTFLKIFMAASVQAGFPIHGKASKQGKVLFAPQEGGDGLALRIEAAFQYLGVETERPIYLDGVNLDGPDVDDIIQDKPDVSLCILDPLAKSIGDRVEDSAGDMTAVLRQAEKISRALSCCVLIVDHVGKDATRGARGSSAKLGSVDAMFLVKRDGDHVSLKAQKIKEGEDGWTLEFAAQKFDCANPETGELSETLVMYEAGLGNLSLPTQVSRVIRDFGPISPKDIAQKLRDMSVTVGAIDRCDTTVTDSNVRQICKRLKDAGTLEKKGGQYVFTTQQ
jgi:hypothetical protein